MPDPSASLKGRWVAWLITLPLIAFGAYILWSGYAPARNTRYGLASSLHGDSAERFGIFIMLLGLLPLLMCAKKSHAPWLGALLGAGLLAQLFFMIAFPNG